MIWGGYALASFPIYYVGLRYGMKWSAPAVSFIWVKAVDALMSLIVSSLMGWFYECRLFLSLKLSIQALLAVIVSVCVTLIWHFGIVPDLFVPLYSNLGRFAKCSPSDSPVFHFGVLTYFFLLFTGWSMFWLMAKRSLDRREEQIGLDEMLRRQQEAEIHLLRSQIPHRFVSEALELIRNESAGNQKLDHLLDAISSYVSRNWGTQLNSLVPLSEEIGASREYFEIEKIRFGDELRLQLDIDPASLGIEIPAVLIQPLLENAVKYGRMSSGQTLLVRIKSSLAENRLTLEISNTGTWFERHADDRNDVGGIGLANVRSRLELLYPGAHEFEISSTDGWVTVKIVIIGSGGTRHSEGRS
ncbi:sensor histidine kinase [Luteolibacter pohnpeiensis]|nr:histidine kinase [Luteolibacter pohnpeiensis]